MNINNAVRKSINDAFADKFTKSSENANIGLSFGDDVEDFGIILSVINWNIVRLGFESDRERFAGVGGREDECGDFVAMLDKGVKNWSLRFNALS